jgi:hypothetical protein
MTYIGLELLRGWACDSRGAEATMSHVTIPSSETLPARLSVVAAKRRIRADNGCSRVGVHLAIQMLAVVLLQG